MGLFNAVHGEVMRELDYPLSPAPAVEPGMLVALAASAARFHQAYLESLSQLGETAKFSRELGARLDFVSGKLRETETQPGEREQALGSLLGCPWLRLGRALGALGRKPKSRARHPVRCHGVGSPR